MVCWFVLVEAKVVVIIGLFVVTAVVYEVEGIGVTVTGLVEVLKYDVF